MKPKEVKQFHEGILKLNMLDFKNPKLIEELAKLHITILDFISMLAPHKRPFVIDPNYKQKIKMKK